ncbi:hypothetical protein BDQ12DRAFT_669875 [Crucibulum laeve]|uniref:Major facilitator superfamily (MFS) profile domain-containing protein n=1 Tax=Crucibulum laeve TaxID=68775 RepID=A0A5C3LMN3_9AGAR|nr:hypothetical protein BDQ12DRAFT_669875 [Crucibulum laeve]
MVHRYSDLEPYSANDQIKSEFDTSHFFVTLGVGLVNLGFSIGPLIAAPLSELYGRQTVYIGSAIAFTRFLGSAVFSNFGGSLSDLFTPDERGPLSPYPHLFYKALLRLDQSQVVLWGNQAEETKNCHVAKCHANATE